MAGLSFACTAAGGLAFVVAVLATQGLLYAGYVSESGVVGQPYRIPYRLGLFGLSAGLVLLAGALRRLAPFAAVVVLVSGVLATMAGTVACSAGCPLPPYETPTPGDLFHAATSVIGVGLCGLAMLILALGRAQSPLRRLARLGLVAVVPASLANVYGLTLVGRGVATGIAERVLLLVVIAWCMAAALQLATPKPGPEKVRGTG